MAANKAPATQRIEGTAQELAERINALAAERMALYRQASSGWTATQPPRAKAINEEMAALWQARRLAHAGRNDDDVPVRHVA